MNIVIPSNIYSAIFALTFNDELKTSVSSKPSSLISKDLESGSADIALIPSLDLINNRELFVSSKFGISFDGYLSNSYLYFKPSQNDFKGLLVQGDVSSNEIILSKIIFSEMYDSQVEIKLDTEEINMEENNYLICGDDNFKNKFFNKGLSFSDEVAELLDFPYTHYLLASKDKSLLEEFTNTLENLDKRIEDNIEKYLQTLNHKSVVQTIIKENMNTVYYELTENETEGLNELLRLPYFHGIMEEVVEIKFV
jgi:predicted solute-binding protein